MKTAREHVASAYIELCAALAATQEESYQSGADDPVPVGAIKRAIYDLEAFSVIPRRHGGERRHD
jgi:hypothetical protein